MLVVLGIAVQQLVDRYLAARRARTQASTTWPATT